MEAVMSDNYSVLTEENKIIADNFIDFLFFRQKSNSDETMEAMREVEEGRAVGPFHSVEELMADLYA